MVSNNIQAEAQCQIWSVAGNELKESGWKSANYSSLQHYVKQLIKESQNGLRQQGLDYKMFDNLPYCTFGWLDLETGEKTIVYTAQTEDDLPTANLKHGDKEVLLFNE